RHVERRFGQWLEKAGVRGRFSPHSLRHSFSLDLYRRTRDIALVQAALRHASITSTTCYARADQQSVREAIGAAQFWLLVAIMRLSLVRSALEYDPIGYDREHLALEYFPITVAGEDRNGHS